MLQQPNGIDAVDLEPVFCETQTDGGNLRGGRLLSLWGLKTTTSWHIDAGSRGRPSHEEFRTGARVAERMLCQTGRALHGHAKPDTP